MKENDTMLEMKNVSFTYQEADCPSLYDISFSLQAGSFAVLCGQSGSGKSTLLRHIKKNQLPIGRMKGGTFYKGTPVCELNDYDSAVEIGYVGQNPESQLVTDKVWHELAFGLENIGMKKEKMRRKVAETAEYFGMGTWFRKDVMVLSGGQKQLLNLASVMAMEPQLLLLDEPTSGLDPIGSRRFIQTLMQLNHDFGTTILLSEQRLEEVLPLADKVLMLHKGKLIYDGTAEGIAERLQEFERTEGEEAPIKDALPTALRIYMEWNSHQGKAGAGTGKPPITVKDGMLFLKAFRADFSGQKAEKTKTIKRETVIQAKHLEYGYGKKERLLRDINLTVEKQNCYAVFGGNGAGKTTLLKLLCGIYKPKSGRCRVMGKTACLPQNPMTLFSEATVEEELLSVAGEAERMLDWLLLSEKKEMNPMDLSGGEKQRLAFGKILLTEPDIILLDEPTKGLDAAFKKKLSEMLAQLKAQGKTILMVSHDIEFCAKNADYCGMLFDGELTAMEKTHSFLKENSFYTTAARRMAVHFDSEAVLWEDVYRQIKGQKPEGKND